MLTLVLARLSRILTRWRSYSIRSSVSRPSLVFLSASVSRIATTTTSLEESTALITSGPKLGDVSITTNSNISPSSRCTSARKGTVIMAA